MKVPKRIGYAGASTTRLETLLNDIADDLGELRTKFIAVLAKLDDDAGVTDTNYESTQTPAARKHIASDE